MLQVYAEALDSLGQGCPDLDFGSFARSLLLVQMLDKSVQTGLTPKILDLYRRPDISSDSRSQLALFLVNEIKTEEPEDWALRVANLVFSRLF